MSELMVPWSEHVAMIRRVGRLEGAIEAHRIMLFSGNAMPADDFLYKMLDEGLSTPWRATDE
jgi:hypothetical protein